MKIKSQNKDFNKVLKKNGVEIKISDRSEYNDMPTVILFSNNEMVEYSLVKQKNKNKFSLKFIYREKAYR